MDSILILLGFVVFFLTVIAITLICWLFYADRAKHEKSPFEKYLEYKADLERLKVFGPMDVLEDEVFLNKLPTGSATRLRDKLDDLISQRELPESANPGLRR